MPLFHRKKLHCGHTKNVEWYTQSLRESLSSETRHEGCAENISYGHSLLLFSEPLTRLHKTVEKKNIE